jgi:hypothetical protein
VKHRNTALGIILMPCFYLPAWRCTKKTKEVIVAEKEEDLNTVENPDDGKTPAEAKKAETEKPIMIPKSRFDEKIAEAARLQAIIDKQTADQEAAQAAALAEQGKYKELWEKAKSEADKNAAALLGLQRDSMRREIATKAGYPTLWNRISGETEDELEADMQTLVGAIPKAAPPDISGGTGSGKRSTDKEEQKMTEAERTYLANVLGVKVDYLP